MSHNDLAQKFYNKNFIELTQRQMFHVIDAFETNSTILNKKKVDIIKFIGRFDIEDLEILFDALRKIDKRKSKRTTYMRFLNCKCMRKFKTVEEFTDYYNLLPKPEDREIFCIKIEKKE